MTSCSKLGKNLLFPITKIVTLIWKSYHIISFMGLNAKALIINNNRYPQAQLTPPLIFIHFFMKIPPISPLWLPVMRLLVARKKSRALWVVPPHVAMTYYLKALLLFPHSNMKITPNIFKFLMVNWLKLLNQRTKSHVKVKPSSISMIKWISWWTCLLLRSMTDLNVFSKRFRRHLPSLKLNLNILLCLEERKNKDKFFKTTTLSTRESGVVKL